jgi:hypothetical protein
MILDLDVMSLPSSEAHRPGLTVFTVSHGASLVEDEEGRSVAMCLAKRISMTIEEVIGEQITITKNTVRVDKSGGLTFAIKVSPLAHHLRVLRIHPVTQLRKRLF